MKEYKFEFPDNLSPEDHQLDSVRRGGTWDDFYDRQIAECRAEGNERRAQSLEEERHLEDRGYCEFCRLRRGTGEVTFLRSKPQALSPQTLVEWLFDDNAAQICIYCAMQMGYVPSGQIVVAVPQEIID